MKFNILLALSFSILFSTFASAQATFDSEKPVKQYTETKVFKALYQETPLMAWTPDENEDLSKHELLLLAKKRSEQICRIFGYKDGEAKEESILMLFDYQERQHFDFRKKKEAYIVNDGKLVKTSDLMESNLLAEAFIIGFFTDDQARFFTEITCYR